VVRIRSEYGDLSEDRESRPGWAITVEEIEQHHIVLGYQHRFSGSTLSAQCELDDVAFLDLPV
jgi:hypothetical protein